jgi:hypothetical protein
MRSRVVRSRFDAQSHCPVGLSALRALATMLMYTHVCVRMAGASAPRSRTTASSGLHGVKALLAVPCRELGSVSVLHVLQKDDRIAQAGRVYVCVCACVCARARVCVCVTVRVCTAEN